MPLFIYRAQESNGQLTEGRIDARDASAVAVELRNRGLVPVRIERDTTGGGSYASVAGINTAPQAAPVSPHPHSTGTGNGRVGAVSRLELAPFLTAVPLPDLAAMYRQLATLLHAGVPMLQAVSALGDQTRQARLKRVLLQAGMLVSSGQPFSAAMERHPAVFSTMQVELIRAGEMGGMLETMCNRIADYLERETEIRRKLKRETLYPKIVLFVAFLTSVVVGFAQAGMGAAGVDVVKAKFTFAATVAGVALFVWNALSYVPVMIGLAAMRGDFRPKATTREPLAAQLRETAVFLRGHRGLRALLGLLAAGSLFMTADWILLPALAKYVFGTDANGFGALMALRGVGALAAALTMASLGRTGQSTRLVPWAGFAWPLLSIATVLSGSFDIARWLIPFAGFAMICFLVGCNQAIQTSTPDHLRGRVMGVHAFLMMGLNPPGSLLASAIAGQWGTSVAVVSGGVATLLFATWFVVRNPVLRTMDLREN